MKTYKVWEPETIVHQPRGFSVSITNEPGIRLMEFHGNVNKAINTLHPDSWISNASSDRIINFDDLSDTEMEEKRDFSKNNPNSNPQSRQNNETINNDENQISTIPHGDFVLSNFNGEK
ncbi:hypothetical protein FQA39_LY10399 [Lamprigera yunnana]|nr:hypothetical protein FQA39_LY10399 [Lamprigera yunnana]